MKLENLRTLILNADYMPLAVVSWEAAFTLLYVKKTVSELDFYENFKVRDGKGKSYTVPAVVVRKRYIKMNYRQIPFSRKNVFWRDGLVCQYCGDKLPPSELTLDHVTPRSRWSSNESPTSFTNVVTCCYPCNRKKADYTCKEIKMFPLHKPVVPQYAELVLGLTPWRSIPKEWMPYLENLPSFKKFLEKNSGKPKVH